jgi:hypothetical protein
MEILVAPARKNKRARTTVGVCAKGIKKELNTIDEADFVRDVLMNALTKTMSIR